MKTYWKIICIASMAGLAPLPCGADDNLPPALPPQVLATMRVAAHDAAINCSHFYDHSRRLQIRSSEMGKSLAAILRLRDTVRKYQNAVSSDYWPRPDWLRVCSENLLTAWINVEVSFPQLEPTPPVVGWWDQSQHSLVDLYRAASPYIGQPAGPLPSVLGVRVSETR
ncbi:MAG: hypothetical protein WA117_17190 [Verrucomicrobiia bacterium]